MPCLAEQAQSFRRAIRAEPYTIRSAASSAHIIASVSNVDWTIIISLSMLVGLVGVAVPVVPGILILWVAALVYGLAVGFGPLGWLVMLVMTLGVAASFIAGVILPKQAADKAGAAGYSQLAGLVGAVIGFFVIPIVGLLVGAMIGVLVSEYLWARDFDKAWNATKGVALGFGKSALVDMALGLIMVAFWAVWALTVVT